MVAAGEPDDQDVRLQGLFNLTLWVTRPRLAPLAMTHD